MQCSRLLGRLLGPLLKTGFSSIKNVIKELAKSVLISSATDAAIHKNAFGSGTTDIILKK